WGRTACRTLKSSADGAPRTIRWITSTMWTRPRGPCGMPKSSPSSVSSSTDDRRLCQCRPPCSRGGNGSASQFGSPLCRFLERRSNPLGSLHFDDGEDSRSGGGDFAETTRHEGLSSGLESPEARRAVHLGVPLEDELPRCLGSETLFREPLRSEEHTSELQSRFDLVCRLLLEKKK